MYSTLFTLPCYTALVCLFYSFLHRLTSWISGFVRGISLLIICACLHQWTILYWKTLMIRLSWLLWCFFLMDIGCLAMNKYSITNGHSSRTRQIQWNQVTYLGLDYHLQVHCLCSLYLPFLYTSFNGSLKIDSDSGALACNRKKL